MSHQSPILEKFNIIKILGRGAEGIVYLVENKGSPGRKVLKLFHEPRTSDWLPGLPVYANRIRRNNLGLPEAKLFFLDGKIIGLEYQYVPLRMIHWRIMHSSDRITKSAVGSFCTKQSFLMKEGLVLCDPALPNLMVDGTGQWHYCDMGGGIGLVDSKYIRDHGLLGYGFAGLVMSLYDKTIYQLVLPTDSYSYEKPCVYWNNEWLKEIAGKHEWVKKLLDEVNDSKSSVFYDPEFYRAIAARFPDRVPNPALVLTLSKMLSWAGKIRGKSGI